MSVTSLHYAGSQHPGFADAELNAAHYATQYKSQAMGYASSGTGLP